MESIEYRRSIPHRGDYDLIVAGGGVAGVAAAVSAARSGLKVLLLEKTIALGGLATIGLINLFVPMCNGRGTQIIKGMAEELLRLSIRYGYDTIPQCWNDGTQGIGKPRYVTRYSAPIFSLALTEWVTQAGVEILYDTQLVDVVMEQKHCRGVVVENKSGLSYYTAAFFADTTGDADLLYRAGIPTVQGGNYHTYCAFGATLASCEATGKDKNFAKLTSYKSGGFSNLYGGGHPEGKPLWSGTDGAEVSRYVVENHLELLERIRKDARSERDILQLPTMPQFRTTRHIDGDATFTVDSAYQHCANSIAAICDFDRVGYLYEVPYGTLVKSGYDNVITAGRSASATGYGWDVLRVIPPAIITGQAAGLACALARKTESGIDRIDVPTLQKQLEAQNVMVHFDDAWIPPEAESQNVSGNDIGHF